MRLVLSILLSALWTSGVATAQDRATPSEAPLGLWSWSADEPRDVLSVAIERSGDEWSGTVSAEPVAVDHDRGVVSVEGPGGGRFVGELAPDESEIRGYWYQPSTPLDYQDVATPAVLPAVAEGRWRADVAVQPRPFRVFLDVFEDGDGASGTPRATTHSARAAFGSWPLGTATGPSWPGTATGNVGTG